MKAHLSRTVKLVLFIPLGVLCCAGWGFAAQSKSSPAAAAPATNKVPAAASADIPQSVFNPTQGRNPFFPHSSQPVPASTQKQTVPTLTPGTPEIILNGITPEGQKRTCMINSRTFEEGESGEVKLSNGRRVLIKCEEIRIDSVIITVTGERRELKLRFGL